MMMREASATLTNSAPNLEDKVTAKIGGRLRDFSVGQVGGQLVLHGKASSYHVKQLAQHEVMSLTDQPILCNQIEVSRAW